jgi:aldose 1-epimerase
MQAHYRVEEDGVTLSLTCANLSATPAPFGVAFHPYLVIPGSTIDQWILTMGAETVVIPDTERFLPIGQSDVAGAGLDFREGAVIDQEFVNHAFGEFSGPTEATLSSPTGVTIRFESSPECPWMHLYRPDAGPFVGAAVLEPQTSPPNGFVDSRDVVDLVPGEDFHVTWRLSVHTAGNPS